MGRHNKILRRFLTKPADFTFPEMRKLLKGFGYEEIKTGKTGGSRVAFVNKARSHVIRFHKPHPSKVMRKYQLDLLEKDLRTQGIIK